MNTGAIRCMTVHRNKSGRRSRFSCAARVAKQQPSAISGAEAAMIQQLRIYEIFEKNKAQFHARFRDHAARIMQTRYGFRIVAMWETTIGDRTEFVYLLEWPDEAIKTAQWAAFMADAEWTEIKRVTHAEHGLMVGEIEDRVL